MDDAEIIIFLGNQIQTLARAVGITPVCSCCTQFNTFQEIVEETVALSLNAIANLKEANNES